MANLHYTPRAVFDTFQSVIKQYQQIRTLENPREAIDQWLGHCFSETNISVPTTASKDYQLVLQFLYSYRGSTDTFTAYRREVERLLQWSWFVREQSIFTHKREDIEAFIEFCRKPYKRWIGLKVVARFQKRDNLRIPNPQWRPFEARVSKSAHKAGDRPTKENYQLSQKGLKVMFGVLSSFYQYLLQEEMVNANPVALIRQKSKFLQKQDTMPMIRRLSELQWQTVLELAKKKVATDPKQARTVFILSCLYGMYLRISELTATERWIPTMADFFQDTEGNWWFKTVGKGNKARQIAVSEAMLAALKDYRQHYLQLPPYPTLNEKTPLIGHSRNPNAAITCQYPIRKLVQNCFNEAADHFVAMGSPREAEMLNVATVHWLRHTGISDDVKIRPREHVRDDAGHTSGAITDRYIDVNLQERAKSAKKKVL